MALVVVPAPGVGGAAAVVAAVRTFGARALVVLPMDEIDRALWHQ